MGTPFSRRTRIALTIILISGLLLFVPMRIALDLGGLKRLGVSAQDVRGSIWNGHIDQLMAGHVALGSVHAALSPWPLLLGRARIDIARQAGQPDDIKGGMTVGFGRLGIDDVTGIVPLGRALAPLPIGSLDMNDVSVRFSGGRCASAEGQVRAHVTAQMPGLNLSQGLSGVAACDGEAMLLPLVSQSGMEKINLRLWQSGRYTAEMRVETADTALAAALAGAGFSRSGTALLVKVEGRL